MSREAFEKWYADHTGDRRIRSYCDSTGRYQFNAMQSAWMAWQAAQAQAVCPHVVTSGTTSWCRLAQSSQAQAGEGEAVAPVGWIVMVDGYYKLFSVYDDALDARKHEEYWNKGIEHPAPRPVYTAPQPAVNQQLLELAKESAELFRFYENLHRVRGPEHLAKAERNAEIAGRIEVAIAAAQEQSK